MLYRTDSASPDLVAPGDKLIDNRGLLMSISTWPPENPTHRDVFRAGLDNLGHDTKPDWTHSDG